MQHFIDIVTGKPWAFEDNVTPTLGANGVYSFHYDHGERKRVLKTPARYAPDVQVPEIKTAAGVTIRAHVLPGDLLEPAIYVDGPLIVYPVVGVPDTLRPMTDGEKTALQVKG